MLASCIIGLLSKIVIFITAWLTAGGSRFWRDADGVFAVRTSAGGARYPAVPG
jgi:Flp pilus assembly protein TadG